MFRFFRHSVSGTCVFLLFLLPQIYQSLHNLTHSHGFHCDAQTEKHFHQAEDECDLCDHVLPNQLATLPGFHHGYFQFGMSWKFNIVSEYIFSRSTDFPDPRGPPVLPVSI